MGALVVTLGGPKSTNDGRVPAVLVSCGCGGNESGLPEQWLDLAVPHDPAERAAQPVRGPFPIQSMIPSAEFLRRLMRQLPAPDLLAKLLRHFPNLGARRTVEEVCLYAGGFPHTLDCSAFAFGSPYVRLAKKPLRDVIAAASQRMLNWHQSRVGLVGENDGPLIAVFGSDVAVQHFCIAHFHADGWPELWVSKFGEGFPVLEHLLEDLDGGGYGELLGFFDGPVDVSGIPAFAPHPDS